jgi:chemotaxis protein CheD
MKHVVGVGDMKIAQAGDVIVTHALGSCLGLTIYDPVTRMGGLLHAMLPLCKINPEKAASNPHMFVESGVACLLQELYQMGVQKKKVIVKAAGCGSPIGKNEMFQIGERNFTILKKILWKNNILLAASDIGGTKSRTVYFDLSTGEVTISSKGEKWLL